MISSDLAQEYFYDHDIIATSEYLDEVLSFIDSREYLAFDIETTGLNVRQDSIIGFGISGSVDGFYVAHQRYNVEKGELETLLSKDDCIVILKALVGKKLITFNGSFDLRFVLHFFGIDLVPYLYSDAMLAKHTVDEEQPFRLKDIAKKLYGLDAVEEQVAMKASIKANGGSANEFYKADLELMAVYCIKDCLLTFKIDRHYHTLMHKQGLLDFFHKDEVMPLYREVTIPMETRGVPVDVKLMEDIQSKIGTDIGNIEFTIRQKIEPLLEKFKDWFLNKEYPAKRKGKYAQALVEIAGLELPRTEKGNYSLTRKVIEELPDSIYRTFLLGGAYLPNDVSLQIKQMLYERDFGKAEMFNLSSKAHLGKLFFDALNEEPLSRTPTGRPQVNDNFLNAMAEKYDWAELLRVYNKLNKLKSTYVDRILDMQEDGIFYPSFFQHRTVSGRYGSDLQQLPRPKEEGELDPVVLKYNNLIRTFFIAGRAGGKACKFVDADYESLEPHVFSHVSGDKGLRDIFIQGYDFYSSIAIPTEDLKDVSADKKSANYLGNVNKPLRQAAKAYCLGVPYGMEEFALGMTLGIEQKEAAKKIRSYMDSFPQLETWMKESNDKVTKDGYIRIESGRIRHFPDAPAIWRAHGRYILDSLKLWKKYGDNPTKYKQMKYLRKKMKNMLDNGKNVQIQGLGASIVNRACIAITRELKRIGFDNAYICMQCHDQIIVRCLEKDSKRIAKIVEYLMCNTYKLSVPLKAPAEIGNNFADAH